MTSKLSRFLSELKRRRVTRVAIAYVVGGIGIVEGVDVIGTPIGLPDWVVPSLSLMVVVGFPVSLALAWALELTPSGIKKTPDLTPEQLASQTPIKWGARGWAVLGVGLALTSISGYLLFSNLTNEVGIGERQRVAVLPPENQTGDPALDVLGFAVADWVTDGLVRTDLASVVPFTEVFAASRALADPNEPTLLHRTWPAETGATLAVLGSFFLSGDSVTFRMRLVDRGGAVLTAIEPVQGSAQDPSSALDGLQLRVARALAVIMAPGHELVWSVSGRHPPLPEAHQAYLQGIELFSSGDQLGSMPLLLRAVDLDPDFVAPLNVLTSLYANLGLYSEMDGVCQELESRTNELVEIERLATQVDCSFVHGDLLGSLRAARRFAEHVPMVTYRVGLHAKDLLRTNEAVEAFAQYDPQASRFARNWAVANFRQWAQAHHMLAQYRHQMDVVKAGQAFSPGSLRDEEIAALIGLRRVSEADRLIADRIAQLNPGQSPVPLLSTYAQVFEVHGFPDRAQIHWAACLEYLGSRPKQEQDGAEGRRTRAEILLFLERNGEAESLLEALVEENPDDLHDLGRLAVIKARRSDESGALKASNDLLVWEQQYLLGSNTLWRARIAAALMDPHEAVTLLGQAMEEGWRAGINPFLDPYLKPIRSHPTFRQFLRPKG